MQQTNEVTILIVDDEAPLRKALVFDFKRRGFKVFDAANGKDAFELVKQNKIDVVLSDVRMPGGDGVELLDRIKELNPTMPVVMFITGFADLSLEEAYDRGAEAVFAKPFDRKALFAAVIKTVTAKNDLWGNRTSERVDVDFEIELQFPELNRAISGKVLNIGRGGIFVSLQEELPGVGATTAFRLRFDQSKTSSIEGSGIVRWVRNQLVEDRLRGCGIEFEYLNDECRKQVIELISAMKTKAFIPKG